MRRSSTHLRNRRLALIGLLSMGLMVAVLVWLDLPATPQGRGVSGSMMDEAGTASPRATWSEGGFKSTMDDHLLITWPNEFSDITRS